MEIKIKGEGEKGVILQAITNLSVNLNYGSGSQLPEKATDVAKYTKNISFSAYLDATGMLYPLEKSEASSYIKTQIEELNKLLFNTEEAKGNTVILDLNQAGSEKCSISSMNISYEMMDKEGNVLRAKIDFQFTNKINEKLKVETNQTNISDEKNAEKETSENNKKFLETAGTVASIGMVAYSVIG